MFCPQCGAEIASDRVRFCTHCRFPVGSVKEFIASETSKNEGEEEKMFYPLRQRDINLGAGLMLIGALKGFIAMTMNHFNRNEFGELAILIGLFFGALILFSQLSPRQRGLTLGATIMFIGSLLGILAGMAMNQPLGIVLAVGVSLVISLLWVWLARMFMQIFFDKKAAPEKKISSHSPPALSAPEVEPITNRMKEPEIAMPLNVTEETTATLGNKQPFTQ